MKSKYSIYIVSNDFQLTNELTTLFNSIHYNVQCFNSTKEYIVFLTHHSPSQECVISEFKTNTIDGLELLAYQKKAQKTFPLIIVSEHATIPMALTSMKAGAYDFLEKPLNHQILLDCVNQAMRKFHFHTPSASIEQFKSLSAREQQVIQLIMEGKLNKEIAHELSISMSTVEAHRRSLRKKLQASNNAELIKHYITAVALCA